MSAEWKVEWLCDGYPGYAFCRDVGQDVSFAKDLSNVFTVRQDTQVISCGNVTSEGVRKAWKGADRDVRPLPPTWYHSVWYWDIEAGRAVTREHGTRLQSYSECLHRTDEVVANGFWLGDNNRIAPSALIKVSFYEVTSCT